MSDRTTLGEAARARLLDRLRGQKRNAGMPNPRMGAGPNVPEAFRRFDRMPAYERLLVSQTAAMEFGIENPYFRVHDAAAGATTRIGGRDFINFSSYDYLGLNRDPRIMAAAEAALAKYGTTASASRLVAGERPVHRDLEAALAAFYAAEDCCVFVSGHATNVSTIGSLFGPKDLILHDALAHNSVIEGVRLSGAHRRSFPHNDWAALDDVLRAVRGDFERVLIVI
ncbi:MAG TPA: aminotransferase class I/II-fold pyridoxal phosphate-dependent enzyme, partial [Acidiphilium sp.]|nr:aminotransferase class I/II-fold pyridoxal phosphate-dependent enzyme [Acidiphilium sp.]